MKSKYKRILIKFSGESLSGAGKSGIDPIIVEELALKIKKIKDLEVEIAIVIGGGNIWRGSFGKNFDRVTSDYMGMLATMINAMAFQNILESINIPTRVQTAIQAQKIAEPFVRRKAIRHLQKGRVVIFAAGTGNPYFTTDTAAVLRAKEIEAEIIFKATKVDGVYNDDPISNSEAIKYDEITFQEAIVKNLKVMDITAFSLCKEKELPLIVFNMTKKDNILKAVCGEKVGTLVHK